MKLKNNLKTKTILKNYHQTALGIEDKQPCFYIDTDLIVIKKSEIERMRDVFLNKDNEEFYNYFINFYNFFNINLYKKNIYKTIPDDTLKISKNVLCNLNYFLNSFLEKENKDFIKNIDLKQIKTASEFALIDETKQNLLHVYVDAENKNTVATNGHILFSQKNNYNISKSFYFMNDVVKYIDVKTDAVDVSFNDKIICYDFNNDYYVITTNIFEQENLEYVAYDRITKNKQQYNEYNYFINVNNNINKIKLNKTDIKALYDIETKETTNCYRFYDTKINYYDVFLDDNAIDTNCSLCRFKLKYLQICYNAIAINKNAVITFKTDTKDNSFIAPFYYNDDNTKIIIMPLKA
jgi:hypothetical protein